MPTEQQNATPQGELQRLRDQVAHLEKELEDAREVIAAIRSGEVDAVVVSGPEGEQIFTLRGAEAAYRDLVEAMNEGAATVSMDGTLLYCNQHFASLFDIRLDHIIGKHLGELVGEETMSFVKPLLARALSGASAKAELSVLSAKGRRVPIQLSVSKMKMEEPTVLCLVVTDLAEAKKWEELVTAGKLTRSILESSPEGIAVCDRHGYIQSLNSVLRRMSASNPLLEHFDLAFPLHIENRGESESRFSIWTALQDVVQSQEVRYRAHDGSDHYLLVSSGPMLDDDGVAGCVLTLTDITGRKKVEQALIQSEKLAAVGRMASSIAHEINNPLESVTNLIYIARGLVDSQDARDHLDIADRELRRVSLITNQTLRFHKQSTNPTEITGEALLTGVTSIYQGRLVNSRIQVEMECRSNQSVRCFEGEIRQVLSNLIGNAVDAMHPDGGRLLLRCREGEDRIGRKGLYLTVADNGPGMSRETQAKTREPFFTTKGFAGTGLGLWVCREILKRHRGELKIRSTQVPPRTGTVITVFLPFAAVSR